VIASIADAAKCLKLATDVADAMESAKQVVVVNEDYF